MEVVGLRGAVPPGEPVQCVVEMLEDLLARARTGDLRAIAWANVRRDGTAGTGWAKPEGGGAGAAVSIETHGLGSAILTLGWRYAAACDD